MSAPDCREGAAIWSKTCGPYPSICTAATRQNASSAILTMNLPRRRHGPEVQICTDFDGVWDRIERHMGETLLQVCGAPFTYVVTGGGVRPDRTDQALPRSHFKRALAGISH